MGYLWTWPRACKAVQIEIRIVVLANCAWAGSGPPRALAPWPCQAIPTGFSDEIIVLRLVKPLHH